MGAGEADCGVGVGLRDAVAEADGEVEPEPEEVPVEGGVPLADGLPDADDVWLDEGLPDTDELSVEAGLPDTDEVAVDSGLPAAVVLGVGLPDAVELPETEPVGVNEMGAPGERDADAVSVPLAVATGVEEPLVLLTAVDVPLMVAAPDRVDERVTVAPADRDAEAAALLVIDGVLVFDGVLVDVASEVREGDTERDGVGGRVAVPVWVGVAAATHGHMRWMRDDTGTAWQVDSIVGSK